MQRLSQVLPTTCQLFRKVVLNQQRTLITSRPPATSQLKPRFTAVQARLTSSDANEHMLSTIQSQTETLDHQKTPHERWQHMSKFALQVTDANPPPDAYYGRSVRVSQHDVGGAFKKLDGILNRNRVKQQLRLTERHEKKGVKRRRLSSERWRKQFANEVRKKVALVIKIKNRGA